MSRAGPHAVDPRRSRHEREQQFTLCSLLLMIAVGGVLIGFQHWISEKRTPADDTAMPPAAQGMSIHTWLDQSQPSITILVHARNGIAAAASRDDLPATGLACQDATDAVARVREHLPSPDALLNQSLQQAVTSYTMGLPDCVTASRTADGLGMQRAASYISDGDAAMQSALDILGDKGGPTVGGPGVLIV